MHYVCELSGAERVPSRDPRCESTVVPSWVALWDYLHTSKKSINLFPIWIRPPIMNHECKQHTFTQPIIEADQIGHEHK